MSRILFHSLHEDAEVSGRERAMMGCLVTDLMFAAIGPLDDLTAPHWTRRLLPPDHYCLRETGPDYTRALRINWSVSYSRVSMVVDEKPVEPWIVALNTAMVIGSDPVRLCARLHGQCEIHCWIDGPNRAWLAGIIEDGRENGIFRSGMGWEDVIELLRSRADDPAVCSYSVTDQFPNPYIAKWPHEQDGWYALGDETKWSLAMAELRKDRDLELKPDNWAQVRFGSGINAFQLYEAAERPRDREKPVKDFDFGA